MDASSFSLENELIVIICDRPPPTPLGLLPLLPSSSSSIERSRKGFVLLLPPVSLLLTAALWFQWERLADTGAAATGSSEVVAVVVEQEGEAAEKSPVLNMATATDGPAAAAIPIGMFGQGWK